VGRDKFIVCRDEFMPAGRLREVQLP
jgi:hypothetical protein